MVCFQPHSLLIGKIWVSVLKFCACPIHCKVHWRVGRRLGLYRLFSVQPLIRLTIRAFSIGSALWVFNIGGSVLSILTQFLSNRSQHVIVDGHRSKLSGYFLTDYINYTLAKNEVPNMYIVGVGFRK